HRDVFLETLGVPIGEFPLDDAPKWRRLERLIERLGCSSETLERRGLDVFAVRGVLSRHHVEQPYGHTGWQGLHEALQLFVLAEGVPTARAEGSKASDQRQGPSQPSTARGCVLRLGIVRPAALARPPSSRVLTLTRHRLLACATPRGGLRSHCTRLASGRCGPLH